MNPKTKIALGGGLILTAALGFAAFRSQSSSTSKHDDVEDTKERTPVSVFLRLHDQATAHALPNMLELIDQVGDQLSVDAHVLGDGADGRDVSLARCAVAQGSVKGLRFLTCRQSMGQGNDDWSACAEDAALSKKDLDKCAAGAESAKLAADAKDVAARMGVTATPTFFVDGKPVEGNGTREAMKRALCASLTPMPSFCTEAPRAGGFPILVMTDSRCPECRAPFWFRRMQMLFPAADISIVDVSTPAGRAQYDQLTPGALPAVVLDHRVKDDPGFARLQRELVEKGESYQLSPKTIRPQFDPTKT